ncbi:hypothetical protein GCM10027605_03090 [Micromonospora zhanjiangensis]
MTGTSRLIGTGMTLGYDRRVIAENLTVAVPDRSFTVVIGPNAGGKSTLLRALSRLLRPTAGAVLLDGADIHRRPARQVARTLGLLPQSSVAPDGITVGELVARGGTRTRGCCASGPATTSGWSHSRWRPPGSPTSPTGWWTSCPAGSGSGCG